MGDLHARFGHGNIRPVTDDDLITSTTIIKCAGINLESRGVAVTGASHVAARFGRTRRTG
jgi:hypothetical protein